MRNMIHADIRRVFRKKIFWIVPIAVLIFSFSSVISMFAINILVKFIPVLAMMGQQNNSPIYSLNTVFDSLKLALSIVIFLALFADDFKAMSMTQMIGYGMSRKKYVISKFIDSVILVLIFYVVLIPVIFLMFAAFGQPLTGEYALYVLLKILFGILKTIANLTISALVFYITNNMPLGIFTVLILQIIPVGLLLMAGSPFMKVFHLDRYYMDGMFNLAHTNFALGLVPEGILWTFLCIFIYIGCILAGTIFFFERKELDF